MKAESSHRVVLVGLDGATFSVLDPLMKDGTMPFLKEFAARGVRSVLHSTPHPLTPQAWTSLMTGRTPGNHGVFDFVRINQDGGHPTYTLVTSRDVECETVWSIASRQSRRVTALNFPCMFPPPEVNGFVVPGYVPWSYLSRSVYPRNLYSRIRSQPGFNARELTIDWSLERKAVQGLPEDELESWVTFHTARERQWFEIVRFLMQEEPCDLTAVVFDGVDRLQHLCYHVIDSGTVSGTQSNKIERLRRLCLDYFRQLDTFLEKIVAMAGSDARVYVASDHGFVAAGDQIFYANVWLQEHGYLEWADGVGIDEKGRVALDDNTESSVLFDWAKTTAFALTSSSNAIFIRQATSPGSPGVSCKEYPAFRQRLTESLLSLTDPSTGLPVMDQILTRDEAFPGRCMGKAPDLTLVLRNLSFLSVLRAEAPLRTRTWPYGTHHPCGIFLGCGPGIRSGENLSPFSIINITPTLLYSLGLPIPSDMEGTVVTSAFEPSFLSSNPIRSGDATLPTGMLGEQPQEYSLDVDAEAQVRQRLKALGYLE